MYQLSQNKGEQPRERESDEESVLEFRLLSAFLKSAEDPEKDLSFFADGVRVGVGVKLSPESRPCAQGSGSCD